MQKRRNVADPCREVLQDKINRTRQRIRTRERNPGKYPAKELEKLYSELAELVEERNSLKRAKMEGYGDEEAYRTPKFDANLAEELFYSKEVQDALLHEPDFKKRQDILTYARFNNGKLKKEYRKCQKQ